MKNAMAVAAQEGWPMYHFDLVNSVFVRAKMDTKAFMKLPLGCGPLTRNTYSKALEIDI